MNKRVVILHNRIKDESNADEADVLNQVKLVSDAYAGLGIETLSVDIGYDLYNDIIEVKKANPLYVFNLTESVYEKGELLYIGPALLNALHIPYTGNPLEALFITTNKVLAKKIMRLHHISTPDFFSISDYSKLNLGDKYIIKPIWEEGSVGLDEDAVFIAGDESKNMIISQLSDSHYFIEKFMEGREFNVSILGGKNRIEVFHPAEMIYHDFPENKPKILGYRAKWDESSIEYKNTTRSFKTLAPDTLVCKKIKELCISCWQSFGLKGYARVDIRLDEHENPFVLEINGNPCISPDSGFIAAAQYMGIDVPTVISRISEDLN